MNIKVRTRQYIAEPSGEGSWLSMDSDGVVREHMSPVALVRHVKAREKRGTKSDEMVVTTIKWRNTPEGFQVPQGG